MKTIIINGQRHLDELPDLWYTDGTDEANEWGKGVWTGSVLFETWAYIGNTDGSYICNGWAYENYACKSHTYITPSEFLRLVYHPWKEGQKVKLPTSYEAVIESIYSATKLSYKDYSNQSKHISACAQLTNIMNFANDAFEGDGKEWVVWNDGDVLSAERFKSHPIRFTSKTAAEWAYKTFPEIFKAYWNV
jgi:hypothetical protein